MKMHPEVIREGREILGMYLAERRDELGMSVEDLAERTGLSWSTIQGVEKGKFSMSLTVFFPLLEALNLNFYLEDKNNPSEGNKIFTEKMNEYRRNGYRDMRRR